METEPAGGWVWIRGHPFERAVRSAAKGCVVVAHRHSERGGHMRESQDARPDSIRGACVCAEGDLAVLIRDRHEPGLPGPVQTVETYGVDPVRGLDPVPLQSLEHHATYVRISDDCEMLVRAGRQFLQLYALDQDRCWQPCSDEEFAATSHFYDVAMSPSGRIVASLYFSGGLVVFRAGPQDGLRQIVHGSFPDALGGQIAISSRGDIAVTTDSGIAVVRTPPESGGQWVARRQDSPPEARPEEVAFSADGELLAARTRGGCLALYRMRAEDAPDMLPEVVALGDGSWDAMAFSPDSRLLVVGSRDNKVRFIAVDPEIGLAAAPPSLEDLRFDSSVVEARFTPKGRLVVITGRPAAITYDGVLEGVPRRVRDASGRWSTARERGLDP